MTLGAHLSISGGMDKAIVAAAGYEFTTVALFLRNQTRWAASALKEETVTDFKKARDKYGISPIVAHGSYLVNLAGEKIVRDKSITAMIEDLSRCEKLSIEYLVLHPGSRPDAEEGIDLIAKALDEIITACEIKSEPGPRILLETTAGQGSCIGYRFEHIADILSRSSRNDRLGVCLDTCHIFAAGYDIRTARGCEETIKTFDKIIGLDKLFAVHLNDSKKPYDSRVDRHEHIGQGLIGLAGLKAFVNHPAIRPLPLILETPKAKKGDPADYDAINAKTVRSMLSEQ
ncbi:MAG TPA: deoxyribonuclease IV [Phycisphaerae bacterium]|nr:deoxyribonuclease IV [Phycisphaerae bacterium]